MSGTRPDAKPEQITFYSYLGVSSDPYFYWLVLAYSIVVVLNVAFLALGYVNLASLKLSYPQWWGIFSEITLFDTPQTLLGIMLSIMLLALVNACLTVTDRKNRTLFFLTLTFLAAFAANFAWYMSPTAKVSSTYGASQIAYAADAILIVYSTFNLLYSYRFPDGRRPKVLLPQHMGLKKFWNMTNLGILISMLIVPLFVPPTLIEPAKGINTFDHAVSFSVSLIVAFVYELVGLIRYRNSKAILLKES